MRFFSCFHRKDRAILLQKQEKKTIFFSQPFPQPFPFFATVPKKISLFFVVAFVENKYLCNHI